jgi:hypothetical protein
VIVDRFGFAEVLEIVGQRSVEAVVPVFVVHRLDLEVLAARHANNGFVLAHFVPPPPANQSRHLSADNNLRHALTVAANNTARENRRHHNWMFRSAEWSFQYTDI